MLLNQAYQLFRMERETYCSPKTMIYYDDNYQRFTKFLTSSSGSVPEELTCSQISRDIILQYIAYLRDSGVKNTSVNTYFRAVKTFISFCIDENLVADDVLRRIKFLKSDQESIIPLDNWEVDEIDGLFNPKTEGGLRNLCMIHLMLDAGFRSSDVVNLKRSYINFDKNYIMAYGKGNKYRSVLLAPHLKKMLYTYLIKYRVFSPKEDYYVFSMIGKDEPISSTAIKQLFRRIQIKTGIERLHPHLLRHTFATSYIMGGGNLEFLRLMLGHTDYATTKLYLHLAQQAKMLHSDIYQLDSIFFRSIY